MPLEFLGAYIWYIIAAVLGFFVIRRRRRKEIKGERHVLVIGHRGAAGYAFQNSLESFQKALDLGVDLLEADIRVSKDGVFFISHENTLKTINGEKFQISASTAAYLESVILLSGTTLLSLNKLVDALPPSCSIWFDLKVKGYEFEFLSFLRNRALIERVFISSHYADSLRLLKVLEPGLVVGISFPKDTINKWWELILLSPILLPLLMIIKFTYPLYIGMVASWARADFVVVQFYIILSKELVNAAHKRGLMVFPFNVKRRRDIIKMIKWGVDGIISDFPDRVSAIVNAKSTTSHN